MKICYGMKYIQYLSFCGLSGEFEDQFLSAANFFSLFLSNLLWSTRPRARERKATAVAVMVKVRTIAMAMEVPSMTDSESAEEDRLPCCGLSTSKFFFTSAVKQHSIVLCTLFNIILF